MGPGNCVFQDAAGLDAILVRKLEGRQQGHSTCVEATSTGGLFRGRLALVATLTGFSIFAQELT